MVEASLVVEESLDVRDSLLKSDEVERSPIMDPVELELSFENSDVVRDSEEVVTSIVSFSGTTPVLISPEVE